MPWRIEYGRGRNNRWYWRLINREDYQWPWIAATGGGGTGHATPQDCLAEIRVAKQKMMLAPPRNVGRIS